MIKPQKPDCEEIKIEDTMIVEEPTLPQPKNNLSNHSNLKTIDIKFYSK
jgi:hypothetical protein